MKRLEEPFCHVQVKNNPYLLEIITTIPRLPARTKQTTIMDATESSPEHVDKGKRRATEATECTPLLASSSRAPSTLSEEAGHPAQSRRGLHRKLKTVFFASLVVCILAFALLGILAWSYASRASALNADDIIHQDLVVAGPDAIEIVNVSQAGAWLNIQGRIGVDAGKAIGVGSNTEDGILDNLWKAFGRWSVRTLDRITVDVSTIRIATDSNKNLDPFLYIDLPQIELPLTVDPPNDTTWLTPMTTLIFIRPTSNTTAWLNFLKESWRRGRLSVHAFVDQAVIRGGPLDKSDWRSILTKKQLGVHTLIDLKRMSCPLHCIAFFSIVLQSLRYPVFLRRVPISPSPQCLNL